MINAASNISSLINESSSQIRLKTTLPSMLSYEHFQEWLLSLEPKATSKDVQEAYDYMLNRMLKMCILFYDSWTSFELN